MTREISKRLAFESDEGLAFAIKQSSIINLPITLKDISNAQQLFGKEVNAIKGKTVQHRTKIIPEQEVDKYNNKSLRLIIDIMFVNNDPYLISVSDHLNLVMVNDLKSYSEKNPKFANSINNVITQIIMRYRTESFFIYEVISDNDTCFKLLSNAINQLNNKL